MNNDGQHCGLVAVNSSNNDNCASGALSRYISLAVNRANGLVGGSVAYPFIAGKLGINFDFGGLCFARTEYQWNRFVKLLAHIIGKNNARNLYMLIGRKNSARKRNDDQQHDGEQCQNKNNRFFHKKLTFQFCRMPTERAESGAKRATEQR